MDDPSTEGEEPCMRAPLHHFRRLGEPRTPMRTSASRTVNWSNERLGSDERLELDERLESGSTRGRKRWTTWQAQ